MGGLGVLGLGAICNPRFLLHARCHALRCYVSHISFQCRSRPYYCRDHHSLQLLGPIRRSPFSPSVLPVSCPYVNQVFAHSRPG